MTIHVEDWCDFVSIFVSKIGDIYTSCNNSEIIRWIPSTNTFVHMTTFETQCQDLFIDINNYLYCSMWDTDTVAKTWLDNEMEIIITVAGTGQTGSAPNELNSPQGIFVDTNLDLYVADSGNDRIQLFPFGVQNGKTVAGQSSTDITIELSSPCAIILDADKYLFIADFANDRIVGSGPNGFRCLVGCKRQGFRSDRLDGPHNLRFDIYGNMFVGDSGNDRVVKFDLQKDSCCK